MENVYKPHHYLFSIGRSIPRVTIGLSILVWLPALILHTFLFHEMFMPLIRLSLVVNLIVFFIALLFSMILHEVCGTTYTISDTAIVKKSPYRTSLIHFENVQRFLYFRLPLIHGFGVVKVPGGSIRLPFIIEHMSACIEDIRKRLEACGKATAFSITNIEEFRSKAIIYELSVMRIVRTSPVLFQMVISFLAESALLAQVFWLMPLKWVVSWTLFGAVMPIIGFLIAEGILNNIASRIAKRNRDSQVSISSAQFFPDIDESTIYWSVAAIMAMVYLIAGILFKQFVFAV
jgi:hypothetical protein